MYNKFYRIKCDWCHKYCKPFDTFQGYGCQYNDRGDICPLDEEHICKKCFDKVYDKEVNSWIERFKTGYRGGDYIKSKFEKDAAKKCGLKWVGSSGVGLLGTDYFLEAGKYYDEKVFNTLSKLPYWGWCMKCGSENKNAYCSNKKCINSFERLDEKRKIKTKENKDWIAEIPF